MSKKAIFIIRTRLPNGEGDLVQMVAEENSATVPEETEVRLCAHIHEGLFSSEHHGVMQFSQISPEKSVLFCPECGLRLEFPAELRTAEELDTHFYLKTKK